MKERTTFASMGAVIAILMFVGHGVLLADPPKTGTSQKRGKTVADSVVSVKEREAMGVESPTWVTKHGKVQPNVYKELKEEKPLNENSLLEVMYKPLRPVGFLRMSYVAVHFRVEKKESKEETRAAIKAVQSSVLSELTAAEFGRWFCFEDHAAILGYANEAALAKLVKNKNVVAIGLDTMPFPMEPPTLFYSEGHEQMDDKQPKIGTQVRAASEKAEYVRVEVRLNEDEVQGPTDIDKIKQAMALQNRVLARLTAEEFRTTFRPLPGGLRGRVNAAGLLKLSKAVDVVSVTLPAEPAKLQGGPRRTP